MAAGIPPSFAQTVLKFFPEPSDEEVHRIFSDRTCSLSEYDSLIEERSSPLGVETLCQAIIRNLPSLYSFECRALHGSDELHKRVGKKLLTPLHAAAITDNLDAARLLIEHGADPTIADAEGWTPLHHAAFSGSKKVAQLLISLGNARLLESRTAFGALFSDLESLLHPCSNDDEKTGLHIKKDGDEHELTAREFREYTGKQYLKDLYVPIELIGSIWEKGARHIKDSLQITREIQSSYLRFHQMPSPHYLLEKIPGAGLSLTAKTSIPPFEIIGEYLGVLCSEVREINDSQLFLPFSPYRGARVIDAKEYSSPIVFINDGFPNVIFMPLPETAGIPVRDVCVSIEEIKEGSPICWGYNATHQVKRGCYRELRKEECDRYIIDLDIEKATYLLSIWGSERRIEMGREEIAEAVKFHYILSTPAVLFRILIEKTIPEERIRSLLDTSSSLGIMRESLLRLLERLLHERKSLEETRMKMREICPIIHRELIDFLLSLPHTLPIEEALDRTLQLISFFGTHGSRFRERGEHAWIQLQRKIVP